MRVESRARARALQAIYAWDVRGEKDLDRVSGQIWDDLAVAPEERKIAGLLLHTLQGDRTELDGLLVEVTTNWRLERLGAIERSVLRLAAAELRRGETPPRVVIRDRSGSRSATEVPTAPICERRAGRLRAGWGDYRTALGFAL